MDPIRAVEILIEKIKQDYADDVSVVVIMGSRIYNETHAKSDVDMYFVPKTERGFKLGKVCIIDGVGFDLWALPWERLEWMAAHEERITSIITEGRVLYYGSEEDRARFNALKEKALDTSDRLFFARKAEEKLNEAYKDYFYLLRAQTLYGVRKHAIRILYALGHAVALLNGETIKRGRGKLKSEIMSMPLRPENFEPLYDTLFETADLAAIRQDYAALLANTESLIQTELSLREGVRTFREGMEYIFEEMINYYNKIAHAAEVGDRVTALFAAVELQLEFEGCFARTGESATSLPDIISAWSPGDLSLLVETARKHQAAVRALLEAHGVPVCEYAGFDELAAYYGDI